MQSGCLSLEVEMFSELNVVYLVQVSKAQKVQSAADSRDAKGNVLEDKG